MTIHFTKALCAAAALLLSATFGGSAAAQSHDGSPATAAPRTLDAPQAAAAATCGKLWFSRVITQDTAASTSSTGFLNLVTYTVTVPNGVNSCIKVLFTAEASCSGSGIDYCYVRATINGAEMFPRGGSFQVLQSEDSTAAGHAYQWFHRVGPGTYVVRVQVRTGSASTTFILDDWTADFEVTF